MKAATYAVKPGDTLHEEFPLSRFPDDRYAIDVHGPNGFYRSFTGDPQAPAVQVHTAYEQRGPQLTGNLQVHLRNTGQHPLTIELQDNSYKTAAATRTILAGHEASITIDLQKNHGWYDFTVKSAGAKSESRYAGRVETGRPSFTDPLMGGVA